MPCTELLRLELSQPVQVPMVNVVAGLFRLLDCLLLQFVPNDKEEANLEREAEVKAALPKKIEPLFIMAIVWCVGARPTMHRGAPSDPS